MCNRFPSQKHMTGLIRVAASVLFLFAGFSGAHAQQLTDPQKNAVRTAENYLSFGGFSKEGLISQLSSEYGDQYEEADARVAVDNLTVDWDEQAKIAASRYLEAMGFSCEGLIDQLSSDYGDKFTRSQATYGAQSAGAC